MSGSWHNHRGIPDSVNDLSLGGRPLSYILILLLQLILERTKILLVNLKMVTVLVVLAGLVQDPTGQLKVMS